MKRLLLAGLAAGALAFTAPAWAQTATPVPVTPPVTQPEAQPEMTPDEQLGVGVQTQPIPAAPPAGEIAADPTVAVSAGAVCQPRVTSVHFGRGAALSLQNRNALEYAVDAASVCNLEQMVISDSGQGRTSSRRTQTVRAALIDRGVPAERILVAENASAEGAATGQLDVRMSFAGVATSGSAAAASTATPTPAQEPTEAEEPSPVT